MHTAWGQTGHTLAAIPAYTTHPSLVLALLLTCGCTVEAPLGQDPVGRFEVVVDTPANLRDQVDLLFVIDNSHNMAKRQEQLAQSFSQVFEHLYFGRGQPDMHIAVVATDIGVGSFEDENTGCTREGKGGTLEMPALRGCSRSGDSYLATMRDVDGTTLSNFPGSLDQAFTCMTQLGETGCEYEQPLEAMRRALDSSLAKGQGFLRPDAVLGVVVLTDEDDCSAFNPALFDPQNPTFLGDDPNFRCFQTGVICDGDDVYKPGLRNDCHPREDSEYVRAIDEYVDYLKTLKPRSEDRVVTAIVGDPENVVIVGEDNDAQLNPSCQDSAGADVYPGIRLSAFVDEFEDTGALSSLCNAGPASGLKGMFHNLRQSLGTTCLEGLVSDIEPDVAGRQVECRVFERDGAGVESEYIELCDNPGDPDHSSDSPCYLIQTGGEACGDFRTQLALQIYGRDAAPSLDTRLIAECRVDD